MNPTSPFETAPKDSTPAPPPGEPEPLPGEPVRITLPEDGGTWPWSVGVAETSVECAPTSFHNLAPFAVTGFAARPEVKRAVVTIKFEKKGQSTSTRVALCDTQAGKVLTEWLVPGYQGVLDLSPDGRAILAAYPQPGTQRSVLRLWVIGSDGQLRPSVWSPHATNRPDGTRLEPGSKPDAGIEIRWAGFVGNDRIVSASRTGQIRVFDTDGGKPLGTLEASPCRPAVTPDGSRIALLAGQSVVLLDPVALKVVGTRWIGTPPPQPVLAFSPAGAKLAIGGNGKATFLNLATGSVEQAILPKLHVTDSGAYDRPFGWVGNGLLFADGRLHDPRFPVPVWDHGGAEYAQFHGSRLWACVRPSGSSTSTVNAYDLPSADTLAQTWAAVNRPDVFALKTGDGIRVDVSGIPEERRGEVSAAIEQRLREVGYQPDPAAPAVLFASVQATGTRTTIGYVGFEPATYLKQAAVLRLVLNGKELWSEESAVEPPLSIRVPTGVALSPHLQKYSPGLPNYKLFGNAPLPTHFPASKAPTASFGTTDLNPEHRVAWLPLW